MDVVNCKGGSVSGRSPTERMLRSSSMKFQEDEGISSNNNSNSQEKKDMNHNMHSSSIERQYKEYKTLEDIKKETSTLLTQSYLRKQGQYSKQLNMQRELEAETKKLQEELKKQIEDEQGVQLAESNAIQPNDELNLMISSPFDDSMLFDKNSTPSIPNYQPVNISASNLNNNNWYNLGSRITKHLYHKSSSIVSNGGLHQLEQPAMFHTGSSDVQDCDTSIKRRSNKLTQVPTTQPAVAFDDCDLREENDEAGASKARLKIPGYQFTPLPPRLTEKSGQLWQQSPRMASRELGQSHRSSQVSSQRMNTRRSSLGGAPYKTDISDRHNIPANQTFVVHKTKGNTSLQNPSQMGYFSGSPTKNGESSQRKAEITSNSSPIYAETASFNSGNVQNNGIQQVAIQPNQPINKKQLTNKSLGNPTFADTFLAFPKQQSLPYPTQQHSNPQQLLLPPGVASDGFSNNYFSQYQDFQNNNPGSLMSQTIQTAGFRSSALPPAFPSPGQSPFFQQKQALQESRCGGFSFMQSQGCVDWSMPSIQTLQKQNSGIDYERKLQNISTNNNIVLDKLDQFTLMSFDNKDTIVNQDNQSKGRKAYSKDNISRISGSSGTDEKNSNMSSIREEVASIERGVKEYGNNNYEIKNENLQEKQNKDKQIQREKDVTGKQPTKTKNQNQNYMILSHQKTSLFISGYRSVYCNDKFQFSRTCKPDSCLVFSQQEDTQQTQNNQEKLLSHWIVERIQFPDKLHTPLQGDCSSSISSLNAHEGVSRDGKNNNINSNNSSTAHQSCQSSQNNLPQIDYLHGHSRLAGVNKPQCINLQQDLLCQVKTEKLQENIVYVIENYRLVVQDLQIGSLNRKNETASVKIQVTEQSTLPQKSSEILIEKTFVLQPGVKYYLGRHSGCQIVIPSTATLVSARHCYFEFNQEDNQIIIADNASSNGTWKCVEELQLSSEMNGFHFKFDGGTIIGNDDKNNNNNNMITIQEINTKSMSSSMLDNICQGCQEQHEQKNQQQYPEYDIVLMNQQKILTGYCFKCFRQLQMHQDYSIRLQI